MGGAMPRRFRLVRGIRSGSLYLMTGPTSFAGTYGAPPIEAMVSILGARSA